MKFAFTPGVSAHAYLPRLYRINIRNDSESQYTEIKGFCVCVPHLWMGFKLFSRQSKHTRIYLPGPSLLFSR